jgi:predicted HAD superfamily Cof-like phosphohydrolase
MWNENDIPKQDIGHPMTIDDWKIALENANKRIKELEGLKDWVSDMIDFETQVMGAKRPKTPTFPDKKTQDLRAMLIAEEVNETLIAMENNDMVEIADGIVDSIVVLIGAALTYGIDIRPIWNEVHKTNMAKVGGKIREDGKKLKPEGWQPPQIKELLEEQGMKF